MELVVKAAGDPARLGILPGSFHPVTRAHVALAEAALDRVDEVLLVMPRAFPHKRYEGVSLADRLELLRQALAGGGRFSIGVSEGGLFLEIARECRAVYGPRCELWLLCGRDAAERIIGWDYTGAPGIAEQLEEYGLLVADREGSFAPPAALAPRVRRLPMSAAWSRVSSSEVRRRIAAGEPWERLVPEAVAPGVRRLYGAAPARS
jgi:nicotinate-nucleotide adenylyltransferase